MASTLASAASTSQNLNLAYEVLLHDRTKAESFCDWVEVDEARNNREALLADVKAILLGLAPYPGPTAFLYQLPKTPLVSRRLVYLPFRDALVRMAVVLIVAERCDTAMIDASFANRRARGEKASVMFLAPWQNYALPLSSNWRSDELDRYGDNCVVAVTDLSGFYDTVSHDSLVMDLGIHAGLQLGGQDEKLIRAILRPKVIYRVPGEATDREAVMTQGLCTGGGPDAFLSNVYLMDIDAELTKGIGFAYGRYCDDITLIGKDVTTVREALARLQTLIHAKALVINTKKTELKSGRAAALALLDQRDVSAAAYAPDLDDHTDLEPYEPPPAFESYDQVFDAADLAAVAGDPAGFCKFVGMGKKAGGGKLLPVVERSVIHVDRLREIAQREPRACKHAAWLLVETAVLKQVAPEVKQAARDAILGLMESPETTPYARLRLTHHLVARTSSGERRHVSFCETAFSSAEQQRLRDIAAQWASHGAWVLRRCSDALLRRLDPETVGKGAPVIGISA